MRTQPVTLGLLILLSLLVAGTGCSKKGIQATSEDEFMQLGEDGTGSGPGSGSTGGLGGPGMTEEDMGGGPFGSRGDSDEFSEADLGPGGSFGSGGGSGSGFGGEFGGGSGAEGGGGEFGGGFAEGGGVFPGGEEEMGSFPEVGGSGPMGSSSGETDGFGTVMPGESPMEDRVGDDPMIARAEPSDAFDSQVEGMQQDRLSEAAGQLEDVFFGYDSWRISEDAKQSLSESAAWLKANPGTTLTIEGHCDERGSSSYNLVLGEKRAKAVRSYLVELGVGPGRVNVVSYGEERPFCNEPTETCYQLNRRGHLVLK